MSALLTLEFQSSRERDSAVNHYSVCGYQHVWSYAPPSKCFRFFTGLHLTPRCSTVQNKSVSANMSMATSLPMTVGTKWTAEKTPAKWMCRSPAALCCLPRRKLPEFSLGSGLMGQPAWLKQPEGQPWPFVFPGLWVQELSTDGTTPYEDNLAICMGVDLVNSERTGVVAQPSGNTLASRYKKEACCSNVEAKLGFHRQGPDKLATTEECACACEQNPENLSWKPFHPSPIMAKYGHKNYIYIFFSSQLLLLKWQLWVYLWLNAYAISFGSIPNYLITIPCLTLS